MSKGKGFAIVLRVGGFLVSGIGSALLFITMLFPTIGRDASASRRGMTTPMIVAMVLTVGGGIVSATGALVATIPRRAVLKTSGLEDGPAQDTEKRLLAIGKRTMGTLTALQQTGTYVNRHPQVDMVFAYQLENGAPVSGTTRRALSVEEQLRFQIGMQFPICYLPDSPGAVALDLRG